jgi:hypothetical protein
MRQKQLKLVSVFLFGLGLTGLQAQIMLVKESGGTQTAYDLSSIRKMTFSGGNATIQNTDNSIGLYALHGLRYFSFEDVSTGIEEQIIQPAKSKLHTYPNPAADILNVDLTRKAGEATVSILTLNGKVWQTQHTKGHCLLTFELGNLAHGIYLCRYSSASEIITVKIIKQ